MSLFPEPLKAYRVYVLMFVLNLAVVAGVIYLLRREPARPVVVTMPPTRVARAETSAARISVTVSGAVNEPGAVQLARGALLAEALQRAGVKPEADLSKLDLTRPLKDGDKIAVPTKSASEPVTQNVTASPTAARVSTVSVMPPAETPRAKLNLNTATLAELDALPGVGETLAQRILDYRQQNGAFKTIEDLKNVKGIGDKLFDDLKELVTVQ
ncbi:MAG: ComE operon protein 1 [Anaerolineae bacterium]|nr:ComE operon protein 1 [Anaerolineae bacterium]